MAKVLGLKQLKQKKYAFIENLPEDFTLSFGRLVENFTMTIWGISGSGKSNLIIQFLKVIMDHGNGKVCYVALEEGHEATMQMSADDIPDEYNGKIEFADHTMTYDELWKKLEKKKSPKYIVIDSIQYWNITYEQYKRLKERFKKKAFIFVSHANGKEPDGKLASRIRYDCGLKVRVEGYIAFVISRYRNKKNYVIWEEGARGYWGKLFQKKLNKIQTIDEKKKKSNTTKSKLNEKASLPQDNALVKSSELVLGEQPDAQSEGEGILSQLAEKVVREHSPKESIQIG